MASYSRKAYVLNLSWTALDPMLIKIVALRVSEAQCANCNQIKGNNCFKQRTGSCFVMMLIISRVVRFAGKSLFLEVKKGLWSHQLFLQYIWAIM